MAVTREAARATAADLPSVDRLLSLAPLVALAATAGREPVLAAARAHLAALRREALAGRLAPARLTDLSLATAIADAVAAAGTRRLRAVFNLTGIVLHTNLGRAPLPEAALEALLEAGRDAVSLEFDLGSGRRGERDAPVAALLAELCGAAAATVVNNNAAALVLVLSALAARREVLVSRGELIEIGGSFRLPDLMRAAGARLVEVGTTNRTHLEDYAAALGPRTALLLKVHPSNYVIRGFTASVSTPALAALARERGVPLAVDLGSGALAALGALGLPSEPVVRDTVAAGADLVTFSGDKLLGGPQAGLVVGRADLVARLARHPLKRALRAGKLTLAALEAVLGLYRDPDSIGRRLPALRLLSRPLVEIEAAARRLVPAVTAALGPDWSVSDAPMSGEIGSGAQPEQALPSHGLEIRRADGRRGAGVGALARRLRALPRPVIGRLANDALWLDLRCLEPDDEGRFVAALAALGP
ncbi:MAG: L-seryl-tRNA(Sec) selenium transferase [Proteobacteria bacterium]|nr:L-seryl-tRNA(Sec) selenium transferase [Pseudomonadota bacterium]